MSGTTLPTISGPGFASRIARTIPTGWAGEDSVQAGIASIYLQTFGEQLAAVLGTLQYLLRATRLTTETSPELDLASQDFFGDTFPRQPGQTDSAFAAAIIANLFKSAATRPAISAALTALTGRTPRMLEPWNLFDTGHWDDTTYWDIDTPAYPARWGAPELRYQGFIETVPAAIPALGPNVPILCFDTTAYWDVPGYFFGEIGSNAAEAVDALVRRLKAEGTIVWLKLVQQPTDALTISLGPATGVTVTNQTFNSVQVSWVAPLLGALPLAYLVQFRPAGTLTWLTGATTGVTTAVLVGLIPATHYEFQVLTASNGATSLSAIVPGTTLGQPPAPATGLIASVVTATAITVQWQPPTSGTPPFSYSVLYRVTGTIPFSTLFVGVGVTSVTVIGLLPSTPYDIEVVTTNT